METKYSLPPIETLGFYNEQRVNKQFFAQLTNEWAVAVWPEIIVDIPTPRYAITFFRLYNSSRAIVLQPDKSLREYFVAYMLYRVRKAECLPRRITFAGTDALVVLNTIYNFLETNGITDGLQINRTDSAANIEVG